MGCRGADSASIRSVTSFPAAASIRLADRVLAHMESFRRPVDARALYVAVSRARDQAHLYTDDRARLTAAIGLRDGHQAAALDHEAGWDAGFEMS